MGRTNRAAEAAGSTREIGMAVTAIGFLLPLLGGGNVFVWIEPQEAIAVFDLAAVAVAGLLARSDRSAAVSERGDRSAAWAAACLLLLFAWWAGTLIFRPHGPRAILEAQGIFAAILLFASLERIPLPPEALWGFVRGLLLGALVTTLYGQYQYWIAFPRTLPLLNAAKIPALTLVNANFYNANCYAAFLAATILMGIGLAAARHGPRAYAAASVLALVGTLLLSESRSAVVLLSVAAASWSAVRLRTAARQAIGRSLPWVSVAAVALAAVVVASVDLREFWSVGFLGRIAIWQGSLAMIRDHWLFGVGLGRFWDYFPSYRVTPYYTRYPHSFLLEVFAELGVIGGTALVGFLAAAVAGPVHSFTRPRDGRISANNWALLAPAVACGLLLAHGLVDIDWHAPANPILLFVLLGFLQHVPRWMK